MRARAPGAEPRRAPSTLRRRARRLVRRVARVRHLAAGFEVERRPLEHDDSRLSRPRARRSGCRARVEQRDDRRRRRPASACSLEAVAGRRAPPASSSDANANSCVFLRLERAARARPLALAFHRALVAFAVDRQPALAGEVLHEVERHAERVVQPERLVARDDRRACGRRAVERLPRAWAGRRSAPRRTAPPRCARPARSRRGCAAAPGTRRPSRATTTSTSAWRNGSVMPELLAVPHRAPHDLAQHVAAPFVRRHDAVGDEERHRAQVVGDHAHRDVRRPSSVAGMRRPARAPIASRIGVNRSVS